MPGVIPDAAPGAMPDAKPGTMPDNVPDAVPGAMTVLRGVSTLAPMVKPLD